MGRFGGGVSASVSACGRFAALVFGSSDRLCAQEKKKKLKKDEKISEKPLQFGAQYGRIYKYDRGLPTPNLGIRSRKQQ